MKQTNTSSLIIILLLIMIGLSSCQEQVTFVPLPELGEVVFNQREDIKEIRSKTAPNGNKLTVFKYEPKNNMEREIAIIDIKGSDSAGKPGIYKKQETWQVEYTDGERWLIQEINNEEEEKLVHNMIQYYVNNEIFETVESMPQVKNGAPVMKQALVESISDTGLLPKGSIINFQFVINQKGKAKLLDVVQGDENLSTEYKGEILKQLIETMAQFEWEAGQKDGVKVRTRIEMPLEII